MDHVVVRVYGKRESPQAYAIRDYLQRSDVPFMRRLTKPHGRPSSRSQLQHLRRTYGLQCGRSSIW